MGHLFSRAIKRFTQCSSRNELPSPSEQQADNSYSTTGGALDAQTTASQQQQQQSVERERVQSIAVGQSIDSADYATLEIRSSPIKVRPEVNTKAKEEEEEEGRQEEVQQQHGVEEAAIKIQALVRGHLTRKALKDAQQQAASVPANALGQSQFDEESLMQTPPSGMLLSHTSAALSAPNSSGRHEQAATGANKIAQAPPLESIAEDARGECGLDTTGAPLAAVHRRASPMSRSLAMVSAESRSDTSTTSEAAASIDLQCDTPASASLDIADHHLFGGGAVASVLHHTRHVGPPLATEPATSERSTQPSEALAGVTINYSHSIDGLPQPAPHSSPSVQNTVESLDETNSNNNNGGGASSLPTSIGGAHNNGALLYTNNSHSIDSAEAAAIRIQSAFRGYHTRKHSPYRRRSPATGGGGGGGGGEQDTSPPPPRTTTTTATEGSAQVNGFEDDDDEQEEEQQQLDQERRPSRQRHRLDDHDDDDDAQNNTLVDVHDTTCSNVDVANHQTQLAESSLSHSECVDETGSSSVLGAALSMNDDCPMSEVHETTSLSWANAASISDELASEARRLVEQLTNGDDDDDAEDNERSAALEVNQEIDDDDDELAAQSDQLAQSIANTILNDDEQHTIELQSDDIERRDPRGDQERARSPRIQCLEAADQQQQQQQRPALVSGPNSIEEEQQQAEMVRDEVVQSSARLGVESPDEAIGSGQSSPALVSSGTSGNSSHEDDDDDDDELNHHNQDALAQLKQEQPQKQQQQQQHAGARNKKRNRANKRKGPKK